MPKQIQVDSEVWEFPDSMTDGQITEAINKEKGLAPGGRAPEQFTDKALEHSAWEKMATKADNLATKAKSAFSGQPVSPALKDKAIAAAGAFAKSAIAPGFVAGNALATGLPQGARDIWTHALSVPAALTGAGPGEDGSVFSSVAQKRIDDLAALGHLSGMAPNTDPYVKQHAENIKTLLANALPAGSKGSAFGRAASEYAIPSPILETPRADAAAEAIAKARKKAENAVLDAAPGDEAAISALAKANARQVPFAEQPSAPKEAPPTVAGALIQAPLKTAGYVGDIMASPEVVALGAVGGKIGSAANALVNLKFTTDTVKNLSTETMDKIGEAYGKHGLAGVLAEMPRVAADLYFLKHMTHGVGRDVAASVDKGIDLAGRYMAEKRNAELATKDKAPEGGAPPLTPPGAVDNAGLPLATSIRPDLPGKDQALLSVRPQEWGQGPLSRGFDTIKSTADINRAPRDPSKTIPLDNLEGIVKEASVQNPGVNYVIDTGLSPSGKAVEASTDGNTVTVYAPQITSAAHAMELLNQGHEVLHARDNAKLAGMTPEQRSAYYENEAVLLGKNFPGVLADVAGQVEAARPRYFPDATPEQLRERIVDEARATLAEHKRVIDPVQKLAAKVRSAFDRPVNQSDYGVALDKTIRGDGGAPGTVGIDYGPILRDALEAREQAINGPRVGYAPGEPLQQAEVFQPTEILPPGVQGPLRGNTQFIDRQGPVLPKSEAQVKGDLVGAFKALAAKRAFQAQAEAQAAAYKIHLAAQEARKEALQAELNQTDAKIAAAEAAKAQGAIPFSEPEAPPPDLRKGRQTTINESDRLLHEWRLRNDPAYAAKWAQAEQAVQQQAFADVLGAKSELQRQLLGEPAPNPDAQVVKPGGLFGQRIPRADEAFIGPRRPASEPPSLTPPEAAEGLPGAPGSLPAPILTDPRAGVDRRATEAPAPAEARVGERRVDYLNAKAVSEMTPEERAEALHMDRLTGLPNARAWDEAINTPEARKDPAIMESFFDLDDLKGLNKKLTPGGVDRVLFPAFGEIVESVQNEMAGKVRAAHIHGDEFRSLGRPEDIKAFWDRVTDLSSKATFVYVDPSNGEIRRQEGVSGSYGIGRNGTEAEVGADVSKKQRKAAGLRIGERDQPPVEVPLGGEPGRPDLGQLPGGPGGEGPAGSPPAAPSIADQIAALRAENARLRGEDPEKRFSLRQEDTEEFKRWFGDWEKDPANASKVVGEDGKPLRVYHGTHADFTAFSRDTIGTATGHPTTKLGFFFTDSPSGADVWSDATLSPGAREVRDRPARTTEEWDRRNEAYLRALSENTGAKTVPVYLSIKKPYPMSRADFQRTFHIMDARGISSLKEDLHRQGYDGIMAEQGGETWYVAFSPTQIKSATGNSGAFDPANPDIRYSARQEEPPANGLNQTETPEARRLRLYHMSTTPGLSEIDPRFQGTGQAGAERRRFFDEGHVPFTNWYTDEPGTMVETHRFQNKPMYRTDGMVTNQPGGIISADLVGDRTPQQLKADGYLGVYYPDHGQVRMFAPVKTEQAGVSPRWPRPTAKGAEYFGSQEQRFSMRREELPELADDVPEQSAFDRSRPIGSQKVFRDGATQISVEAVPSTSIQHMAGIENTEYATRRAHLTDVAATRLDRAGDNRLARALGLDVTGAMKTPGMWKKSTNPTQQMFLSKDPFSDSKLSEADAIKAYMAAEGYINRQDAVGSHKARYAAEGEESNGAEVVIGRTPTPSETARFDAMVKRASAARGVDPEAVVTVTSDDGFHVWNYMGDAGLAADASASARLLYSDKKRRLDVTSRPAIYDGDLVSNDWTKAPNGEEYLAMIPPEAVPLVKSIADHTHRVNKAYARANGMDPSGYATPVLPRKPERHVKIPADMEAILGEDLGTAKGKVRQNLLQNIADMVGKRDLDEYMAAALAGKAAQGWYERSADMLRAIFGKDTERFVAALAATSPRQSVAKSLEQTIAVWSAWNEAGRPKDLATLEAILRTADNKLLVQMETRHSNVVRALSADNPGLENTLSGLKVESFRKNLLGQLHAVTNDTWMAKIGEFRDSDFGSKAGYLASTYLARKVADKLGVRPAEVQEAIWSFYRYVYDKTGPGKKAADVIATMTPAEMVKDMDAFHQLMEDPNVQAKLSATGADLSRVAEFTHPEPTGSILGPEGAGDSAALGRVGDRIQRQRDASYAAERLAALAEDGAAFSTDPAILRSLGEKVGIPQIRRSQAQLAETLTDFGANVQEPRYSMRPSELFKDKLEQATEGRPDMPDYVRSVLTASRLKGGEGLSLESNVDKFLASVFRFTLPLEKVDKMMRWTGTDKSIATAAEAASGASGRALVQFHEDMKPILEAVGEKNLAEFSAYLVAKRRLEMAEKRPDMKSPVSVEDAQATVDHGRARFDEQAQAFTAKLNGKMREARDAGLLTDIQVRDMESAWNSYVPLEHVFDTEAAAIGSKKSKPGSIASVFKRIKGSETDYRNVFVASLDRYRRVTEAIENNEVGKRLVQAYTENPELMKGVIEHVSDVRKGLDDAEVNRIIRQHQEKTGETLTPEAVRAMDQFIGRSRTGLTSVDNVIRVKIDGQEQHYQVHPEIAKAFSTMGAAGIDAWARFFGSPARLVKAGTTLDPVFALFNTIRDVPDSILQTESRKSIGDFARLPGDWAASITDAAAAAWLGKESQTYKDWVKSGSSFSQLNSTAKSLEKGLESTLPGGSKLSTLRPDRIPGTLLRGLRAFGEPFEQATRLAEFRAAKRKGLSDEQAGKRSRDITTNFAMHGNSRLVRDVAQLVPFMNPGLQSLYRSGQAAGFGKMAEGDWKGGGKSFGALALKGAAFITLPTVVNWLMNHGDKEIEDYRKTPAGKLFWYIRQDKDTVWRIPKPFVYGQVFGTGAESILDAMADKDPRAMKRWATGIWEQGAPDVAIPTIIALYGQLKDNKDWFTQGNIVPPSKVNMDARLQSRVGTSETMNRLAEAAPGEGFSPAKAEWLAGAIGGSLARNVLHSVDLMVPRSHGGEKPALMKTDVPFVGRLFARMPNTNTESSLNFREQAKESEGAKRSLEAYAKQGGLTDERVRDLAPKAAFSKSDANFNSTLKKLATQKEQINLAPGISAEDKRILIDALTRAENRIQQAAVRPPR